MLKMKDKNLNLYSIMIIGGGAGGLFASSTSNFFGLSNIIIEQKPYLGGQPIELYPNKYVYDFPCFKKIKAGELISMLINQQKESNYSKVSLNDQIISISESMLEDEKIFFVQTKKNSFFTKNIIVASGNGAFAPNKLEVNGSIIEDACIQYSVDLSLDLYKNKKIVILGGGDSAVDWANFFVEENISNDVSIVHRRNQYRCSSSMIDELKKNKIVEKLNYDIFSIDVKNKLLSIMHKDTKEVENLDYDFIIVQYGQSFSGNNIEFLENAKKEKNKFIVDINQKTSIPFVYAIGDSIIYEYKANTIVTACAEATKCIWHISKNKDRKW